MIIGFILFALGILGIFLSERALELYEGSIAITRDWMPEIRQGVIKGFARRQREAYKLKSNSRALLIISLFIIIMWADGGEEQFDNIPESDDSIGKTEDVYIIYRR